MLLRYLVTLVCALIWSCLVVEAKAESNRYTLDHSEGQHLDVVAPGGHTVLRYVYARDTSDPATTFDTAKVFAHVMAPDGKTTLTKGPGGRYPHHRGIFIGWSKIKHDGKSHDLWHVRNTAQLHDEFIETTSDENGAAVTSRVNWIGVHGKPLIKEQRTYRVVKRDDAYAVIDFVSELTAVGGDVTLDGDPEHAGIQFRPSQQVAENKSAKYTFHAEGIDPREQEDLPWVAATFEVDGQTWTVQHMSHPQNPPGARWSAYRDYGRFGPFTVVQIPEGQSCTFRYRFRMTQGGALPRKAFAGSYERYAQGHVR